MGLIVLLALAGAAFGLAALLGVQRLLWWLVGAALMLGAAGYALQGRPTLAGADATAVRPDTDQDAELDALRDRMLGRYTGDAAYVVAADAMLRSGEPRAATQWLFAGINHVPESVLLWTTLGSTLAEHDAGQVSPPALFAFQQAARLSPQHPGPPFFLGIAYVRSGEFAKAQPLWRHALALAPDASYRQDIALRLALLDRLLADQEGAAGPAAR